MYLGTWTGTLREGQSSPKVCGAQVATHCPNKPLNAVGSKVTARFLAVYCPSATITGSEASGARICGSFLVVYHHFAIPGQISSVSDGMLPSLSIK